MQRSDVLWWRWTTGIIQRPAVAASSLSGEKHVLGELLHRHTDTLWVVHAPVSRLLDGLSSHSRCNCPVKCSVSAVFAHSTDVVGAQCGWWQGRVAGSLQDFCLSDGLQHSQQTVAPLRIQTAAAIVLTVCACRGG